MNYVLDRFLAYCKIPSQSDPSRASRVPSTPSQHKVSELVAQDLRELGAEQVSCDEHAYVTASWPASPGKEELPALCLCAHVDTAWQANGDKVSPRVEHYEGGKLVMGVLDGREVFTDPHDNPELADLVGQDIVVTDGSSLLGGDAKAGIAEILALLKRLKEQPELPHPRLAIAIVPDEEIGHGARLLDLESFGARWGYTLDGGPLGEFSHECFYACDAFVRSRGFSVHTGTAKNLMVNASELIYRFHSLLPPQARPEYTEGYEGFYYLSELEGNCEVAHANYIIRDHSLKKFEAKKRLMQKAVDYINQSLGADYLSLTFEETYRNMSEVILKHPHLIHNARAAYAACGIEMKTIPMRGGTDGSQLCFRGLPCPNLSSGYHNAHGPKEFVPVLELEKMVDVLEKLVACYAKPQVET